MGSTLTRISRLSITLRLSAVALLIVGAVAAQAALEDSPSGGHAHSHGVGVARCGDAILGPAQGPGPGDAALGPLVLVGAQSTASMGRNAFGNHGYKIPATLPRGEIATLTVPRTLRKEVGLVFTESVAERVDSRGVRAANAAIRFTACPNRDAKEPTRSGWAGGIVVDRPRCAVLHLRRRGEDPITRRVPLGRACTHPST